MSHNTKISNTKKINDWIYLRNTIDANPNELSNWEKAFDNFLMDRIQSRYLNPIEEIRKNINGEGFAIVTIQCSLIEFLETSITGETYKYRNPNPGQFEYNQSSQKFKSFLINRFPFNTIFNDQLATNFYQDVRCGLLHEAQTKNKWLIRMDNKSDLIETNADGMKVFDRSRFQSLLKIFFKRYKKDLLKDANLQTALRRKINVICRLPILD